MPKLTGKQYEQAEQLFAELQTAQAELHAKANELEKLLTEAAGEDVEIDSTDDIIDVEFDTWLEEQRDWEYSAQFMTEFDPSKSGPGLGEDD